MGSAATVIDHIHIYIHVDLASKHISTDAVRNEHYYRGILFIDRFVLVISSEASLLRGIRCPLIAFCIGN